MPGVGNVEIDDATLSRLADGNQGLLSTRIDLQRAAQLLVSDGIDYCGLTIGEIVNLMQIDAGKMEMFVSQLHVTWDGAFQIIGYVVVLIVYINWAALIGLVVMILAMPVQKKVMVRLFMLSRMMVKDTDQRVKVTNECLQGMLCLKMYAWEDSFIAQIESYRQRELTQLKKIAYLRAFARCYMMAVPAVVSVVSLSVYAVAGGDVRPSILFAALAAFNQLRFPLMFYPMTLAQYATMKVSQTRLAEFLSMPELAAGLGVRKLLDCKHQGATATAAAFGPC